jgi:hypothetical protein
MNKLLGLADKFLDILGTDAMSQRILPVINKMIPKDSMPFYPSVTIDDCLKELRAGQIWVSREDLFQFFKQLERMRLEEMFVGYVTIGRRGYCTRFLFSPIAILSLSFALELRHRYKG